MSCLYKRTLFDDREGEADHYFPRKKYPALTLHPYNILPVCSDCNGASVKHEKVRSPMRTGVPGELRYVFLPYLRAAKPEVEFEVSDDESRRIVMHPAAGTGPYTQRRIENMERCTAWESAGEKSYSIPVTISVRSWRKSAARQIQMRNGLQSCGNCWRRTGRVQKEDRNS